MSVQLGHNCSARFSAAASVPEDVYFLVTVCSSLTYGQALLAVTERLINSSCRSDLSSKGGWGKRGSGISGPTVAPAAGS